jgi:hypothetical protein
MSFMSDDLTQTVAPVPPSLMDLAGLMAPWAHLKSIRLLRSTIESKPIPITQPVRLQVSFDATPVVNRENGELEVLASLSVSGGEHVQITGEFGLTYIIQKIDSFSDEIVTAFAKMNGIYNIWPYWREYVQSTVARLCFPPMTVPLMTGPSILAYHTAKSRSVDSPQVAQQQEESGPRLGGTTVL